MWKWIMVDIEALINIQMNNGKYCALWDMQKTVNNKAVPVFLTNAFPAMNCSIGRINMQSNKIPIKKHILIDSMLQKYRQAFSSQYLSESTKITTNTETAMLSIDL